MAGYQVGQTVAVKIPPASQVFTGNVFAGGGSAPDQVESSVNLTVSTQQHVPLAFTAIQKAMFLTDFRDRFLKPAIQTLASQVQANMLVIAKNSVANTVGLPGSVPTSMLTYGQGRAKLENFLAPDNDRSLLFSSDANLNLVDASKGLLNPTKEVADMFYKGYIGSANDMEFFECQSLPVHTNGNQAAWTINGANQTGTQVVTNGWTAASLSLNVGDRVTFAGCYEINGQSRLVLPNVLKQFVITAPVVDAAGAATLSIFPAIIPSGPYQNCSASPTNGGAVTVAGASGAQAQTAFALQQGAYTWAAIRLQDVSDFGANCTVMTDEDTGISIRCTQQWDNRLAEVTYRMDFVWGIAQTYADYEACVIYG